MFKHHILFRDEISGNSVLFENPSEILIANTPNELFDLLSRIEYIRSTGKWIAGYLSYEAGFHFEPKLQPLMPIKRRTHLACFGIFDSPSDEQIPKQSKIEKDTFFGKAIPAWDFETYKTKFDKLIHHMQVGDCYQGNLTFPLVSTWQGNPFELFTMLHDLQPVSHAAYVNLSGPIILSRSPELFFRIERDGWIEARPMKGTAPRGKTRMEDVIIGEELQKDPKNISENTMIVDLLRNDISHISEEGSVHVPQLYELKTFVTLHQLVSRVRGKLKEGTSFTDVLDALFPCGSITGAPKIRAMEILNELEDGEARDVYCGAIGWIEPSGAMQFNVPIRTVSLYEDHIARFNVGGGITLGSSAKSEYDECLLKARFATNLAKHYH